MPGPGSNPNWPAMQVLVDFTSPGAVQIVLSGALSTGAPITSLPVTALTSALPSGKSVMLQFGTHMQVWTTTANALVGATSISVSSQTPNFAYPASTTLTAWTDITSFCRRLNSGELFHIERGRNYERGQTDAGTCNIVIDNSKGDFDPNNSASAFYPNVKPIRKIQMLATWAGTPYYLFSGTVEDWPRIWKMSGFYGEITLTARGPLSSLSTVTLNAAWVASAIRDGAQAIYRLNDASGSVQATNFSSFQQNYAPIVYGHETTPTSKFEFGNNAGSGNLAGDPTNSLTLTPVDAGGPLGDAGFCLQTASPSDSSSGLLFSSGGGWSWEGWFNTYSPRQTPVLRTLFEQTADLGSLILNIDSNGTYQLSALLGGVSNFVEVDVNGNFNDLAWHHVVITFANDARTLKVYIDGVLAGSGVAPGAIGSFGTVGNQYVGGKGPITSGVGGNPYFNGSVKNTAWYTNQVLTLAQVSDHFLAGQGYLGDDTGARIARIMGYVPYPLVACDTGNSFLGRANLEGKNVTQAIQDANDTEVGTVYERGDGYVVFKNRHSRSPANALFATMGEPEEVTLTSGLTLSTPITALPVTATRFPLAAGSAVTVTSGANTQTWTLSTAAAPGSTSLAVNRLTALASTLSTGGPITALPVSSLPVSLAAGATVTLVSGTHTQVWTLTAAVVASASPLSLPVSSQTPNFAYPSGTTFVTYGVLTNFAYPLGSLVTNGSSPYQDDFTLQQDSKEIFTNVVVARDTGITVTVIDTAAELEYYPRTLNIQSNDNTDIYAINLAQYQLGRYKIPRDRIPTLTLVPSANIALWAVALGAEIGTRVTVTRNNPGAPPMSEDFYIEKIAHDASTGVWKTSFMLSTAALWDTTFVLDTVAFGTLDVNQLGF